MSSKHGTSLTNTPALYISPFHIFQKSNRNCPHSYFMALQIISSCKNLHWRELVSFQNVADQHFASSCKFSARLIVNLWSELGLTVMSVNGFFREVKGFVEGMHSGFVFPI